MAQRKKPARSRKPPRPPREGTKRATIVKLMSRKGGASRDQLKRATKWDDKTLYDGVRLVRIAGYPVREVGDRFVIGRPAAKRRRAARPAAEVSA